MRAGSLRHRIVIQSSTESRDAHGGVTRTWSTAGTRWGSIKPVSAKELMSSDQVEAQVTHTIMLRHYSGLTPSHRMTHGGRTFEIVSVINAGERDIKTTVTAREVI